jgi:hypothetical protein
MWNYICTGYPTWYRCEKLYWVVLSLDTIVPCPPPSTAVTRMFPSSFAFSFLCFLPVFLSSTSHSHIHTHRLTIIYLQSHISTIIHSLTIIHPHQDLHEHTNNHNNTSRITRIHKESQKCTSTTSRIDEEKWEKKEKTWFASVRRPPWPPCRVAPGPPAAPRARLRRA